MCSSFTASPAATTAQFELAEGILWDDRAGLVRWVDIWRGRVLSGRLDQGLIEGITAIEMDQTAGAVAVADDGGLLVAAARRVVSVIASDGTISHGPQYLGDRVAVRSSTTVPSILKGDS